MPAKRSPWFSARTEPPVNGDRHALYERRCPLGNIAHEVELVGKTRLIDSACDRCQWRGLLREDGGKA